MKLSKEYREKFVFIVNTDMGPKYYTKDVFMEFVRKIRENSEEFNIQGFELDEFLNTQVTDGFVDEDGNIIGGSSG